MAREVLEVCDAANKVRRLTRDFNDERTNLLM